jgi:predicted transposase YbfD/YdcC
MSTDTTPELSRRALVSLLACLVVVSDPRGRKGRLHLFSDLLAILILGTVCGCDDADALEEWAIKEEPWLRTFLRLPNGIPSQDTYLRALASLDPAQFRAAFRAWAQEVFSLFGVTGQIALDGKEIRGAREHQVNHSLRMVSAFSCESGLVLGQLRTQEKSNEITAMPELLRLLSIKGALISADAMGCQVEIAETIVSQENDYLFGLKGNQPTLNSEVAELFKEAQDERKRTVEEERPEVKKDEQVDSGHGRIETRQATVSYDVKGWVPSAKRFPKLTTLIKIEATVEEKTGDKKTSEERYYISSARLTAKQANEAVRTHWFIENQLHWSLDVTFGEDECRIRTKNAAENVAVVRHFAMNLVKGYKGDRLSMRRRRRRCDYQPEYRMRVLAASVK